MRRLARVATTLAAIGAALAGCIVSDELTTFTIRPDGSADLVMFRSNLRSTEAGAKADEELRRYVESFDARRDEDFARIREAGGEVLSAQWLRREAPCSNVLSARFPSAAALEKFCTIRGEDGDPQLETRFATDGARRSLRLVFVPPKDFKLSEPATLVEARQELADGISEIRFAVTGGAIVASRGFRVASDRRSALLALDELQELLRAAPRRVELFLEWEVLAK